LLREAGRFGARSEADFTEIRIRNLMLKEEVVVALKEGKFHIYPVSTIDQGIEVLTGVKAGKRRKDGRFEPDSINDRVQKRLTSLAEKLRDFTKGEEKEEKTKANGGGNLKE